MKSEQCADELRSWDLGDGIECERKRPRDCGGVFDEKTLRPKPQRITAGAALLQAAEQPA